MSLSENTLDALKDHKAEWAANITAFADSIVRFQANPDDTEKLAVWAEANGIPGRVEDLKYFMNRFYSSLGIILDMVSKLGKYDKLSDKQWKFLDSLGDATFRLDMDAFVADIKVKMQARVDEMANATEVPDDGAKRSVSGEVVSIKRGVFTQFGPQDKMLIKTDDGYKLYGTIPSAISDKVDRGSKVSFTARLKRSDNDSYFGFFNRPTGAKVGV